MNKFKILLIFVISATCLIFVGCATNKYEVPVTSFQKSIDVAASSMGTYYRELNSFEREIYLDERVYDPNLEVAWKDKEGKPTALGGRFGDESIQARLDCLTVLGIYGERLKALATTTAPERFAQGAQLMGENLLNLGERLKTLDPKIDTTAFQYAAPIGTLVGVVGRMYLERKRDEMIRAAINDGAPAVNRILDLLEVDLNQRIMPLRTSGAKELLFNRVAYYNDNRMKWSSPEARRQPLNDIGQAVERYHLVQSANPVGLVQAMREAHAKLVAYSGSAKKPENLAELVGALELFKNRVTEIANAIQQIRKVGK